MNFQRSRNQSLSTNLFDDLKVTGLQATLRNLETGKEEKIPPLNGYRAEREVLKDGPTQAALREARRGTGSSAGGEPLPAEQTTFEERKKADKRAQVRYPISCYCYCIVIALVGHSSSCHRKALDITIG